MLTWKIRMTGSMSATGIVRPISRVGLVAGYVKYVISSYILHLRVSWVGNGLPVRVLRAVQFNDSTNVSVAPAILMLLPAT